MADTAVATKWRYKAEYLEFCNCSYGCPCNFNGFPDKGNCQAVVGYQFLEGDCGGVDLAGATLVLAAKWPKAIHDGDGKVAVFFDKFTKPEQMEALGAIFTNVYGGLPHEIIGPTITEMLGPFVEDIEFVVKGTESSIKIGNKISAAMTSFTSPVEPHEPNDVRIMLPSGFIWQEAKAAKNTGQKVNVDGLAFQDKDCNAFYSVVEHKN